MGRRREIQDEWIEAAALLGFEVEKEYASGTIDGFRVWVGNWADDGGTGSLANVELSGSPAGLRMDRWTLVDGVTAWVLNRLPWGRVRRRIRCPGKDKKLMAPDRDELERWLTPERETALCSVSSTIQWRRPPATVGMGYPVEWGHQPKALIMSLNDIHSKHTSGEIVALVNEALDEARRITGH